MFKAATRIAGFLKKQTFIKIVTHIDADGITSGAIASLALERAGIRHEVEFVKQLDNQKVEELRSYENPIWFTDLGSGKIREFQRNDIVVTDHHLPTITGMQKKKRENLLTFFEELEKERYHLNPHLFGHNGATEISGAGLTYLVARAMSGNNTDLAALAIVGAVGDLQDTAECRLIGLNRMVLDDGLKRKVAETVNDLRYFGRETRPLHKFLTYSSDPIIPSISGNETGALEFLMETGIELKRGDEFRCWIELTRQEKRKIISGMVKLALTMGLEPTDVKRLVGEVYSLPMEEAGTPLHDAKEFATMLNACGKNLNPEIGLHVCKGDRGEFLERAYILLQGHRRALAGLIRMVEESGIEKRELIQFFYGGDDIPENLVGIISGMILNSGSADPTRVMVGFANAENGLKVSARTTRALVKKGIDLAEGLKQASIMVGGEGGGHNIAAGAFIPENSLEEFLKIFEDVLKKQIL